MAKSKNYKISYKTEEQKEVTKLIIIILVVTLFVVGAYFLTRAVVTKDLKSTKEEEKTQEPAINYDVAIVGEILNRSDSKYYVAVYDFEKEYASEMVTAITSYKSAKGHLRVYSVDLSNKLNEGFYDPKNVKLKVKDVTEFKFGDVTLLKIEGGKVTAAITDLSKIKKELKA